ncbi:MAG: M20/M25/M40 family metallo-hydrolase [Oligoflexia bacterium]|nr:M20/M25/M40 family metallo-hydrolase [Oligoflexia bacterium]
MTSPETAPQSSLDQRVARLAARDLPLARQILAEAIRIPADYVDRPPQAGGDPLCGLSNHEGPRLQYLRQMIIGIGAVRCEEDVGFDAYGNLVWTVQDPDDGIAPADKKVVYMDGHTDTVKALRDVWQDKIGDGIDAYKGLVDRDQIDHEFLRRELGWMPPQDELEHLIYGRGSADQLGGVVAEIIATRILLELADQGALRGVIVRAYGTAAEEDNDGAGPMYVVREILPGAPLELVPDVVVLTEGTGDANKGSLGIYRGQRGRMQIQVQIVGRSCHGSMPWEGLNPLEWGARILVEATKQTDAMDGFLDDEFLGHGTRTASWAQLDSPSDCAVPDTFTFRFDRRLTVGEDPEDARASVESLPAVAAARQAGLQVDVTVPHYDQPTWTGYQPGNPQIYMGWVTPQDHPAIQAAVRTYQAVVTPAVGDSPQTTGNLRALPRVDRWIFSTDGVGFPVRKGRHGIAGTQRKGWVSAGAFEHPPMFGCGPGIEQNTHKIGECMDTRELQHAIAFLARFPSVFAGG